MTEQSAASPGASDDFLDLGTYGATDEGGRGDQPVYASAPVEIPGSRRRLSAASPVLWLIGGVAAGAVIVLAWHSSGSGTTTGPQGNAAAASQLPGANGQLPGGQLPNGQVPNGAAPNGTQGQPRGQAPLGGGFGGRAGEQHLLGSISAVGPSTLTVRTSVGMTAYPISSNTQIVKNGQPASLSSLSPGDTVLLHVYPLNGKTFVERVIDGGAQGRFFGGPDDQNSGSGGDDQSGTET